ncbi:DNA-binding SARP family transcriptional activator [Rhodococcus sp. 27YEA15]|uniref:AfsR/SARP family transcriptional regulator n=1 Tax=Rhodococcus sp. 27YEA15 TaxID=3156259 RepID=UPI003C7CE5A4
MDIKIGILGPTAAWSSTGDDVPLKGPRHRMLLARLILARGRAVPLSVLVDDVWERPPADPVGALRTFVGDLRRALEPNRPPRATPQILVTKGHGYALRVPPRNVDAWAFEKSVNAARMMAPQAAESELATALQSWRGPALSDVDSEPWARAERSRLTELRLQSVEIHARARIDLGRIEETIPDLDAHVADHPWRENGWHMLASALNQMGRQGDALATIRRARTILADNLGIDPGPQLQQLETEILRQTDSRTDSRTGTEGSERLWITATDSFRQATASSGGSRTHLRTTVDVLRNLAITGGSGLRLARAQRLTAIRAAEDIGDVELTARVVGAYDVPAIWTRSDDEDQAAAVVAAARRTLARLPDDASDTIRAKLLSTIAIECRGRPDRGGIVAAAQAEQLARGVDDPAVLAFALGGVFMQSFGRTGLAGTRDGIGAELISLSARGELTTYEILGHLVRMQANCALDELEIADFHAEAADTLAARYESPLVSLFTRLFRALRLAMTDQSPAVVAAAYRAAEGELANSGMPGLADGLIPLALLAVRVRHGRPAPVDPDIDWGVHLPWVRPLVLLAQGNPEGAAEALRVVPTPPPGHLAEALWCLVARAAVAVDDQVAMRRAYVALLPAKAEIAGAGSGVVTLGPTADHLAALSTALKR